MSVTKGSGQEEVGVNWETRKDFQGNENGLKIVSVLVHIDEAM